MVTCESRRRLFQVFFLAPQAPSVASKARCGMSIFSQKRIVYVRVNMFTGKA